MPTVGENIKRYRKSKKITQGELGALVGMTASAIMRYEKGDRDISMTNLKAIAKSLEVSVSDLVWEGEGTAPKPLRGVSTPSGSYLLSPDDHWEDENGVGHTEPERLPVPPTPKVRIDAALYKLNPTGQDVAAGRVEELTKIPDYQKPKDPPERR